MKTNILFRSSLLLALLALGCAKQVEEDFQEEELRGGVRFAAEADYSYIWQQGKFSEDGTVTKTEYSGEYNTDLTATPVYERINWTSGDNITLSMTTRTAGASSFGTVVTERSHYDVTPGSITSGSKTHGASVKASSGQQNLKWQQGNYDYLFRGVYPAYTDSWISTLKAKGAEFKNNNYLVDNSGDARRSDWISAVDATVQRNDEVAFVIPRNQNGSGSQKTEGDVTTVCADMRFATMAAVTTVLKSGAGAGNTVALGFRPLFNAYEFRIAPVNDAASLSGKKLLQARLYVDEDHDVGLTGMWVEKVSGSHTGNYAAKDPFGNGNANVYASATNDSYLYWRNLCSKEAVLSLSDLTFDHEIRLTFLSLPVEASGLVLELSFSDNIVRKLPLKTSGGQFISVHPGHKLLVSNLDVPGWEYILTAPSQVNLGAEGGNAYLSGSEYIYSYKRSLVNNNITQPVNIQDVEFLDKDGNVVTSAPEWLNGYYPNTSTSDYQAIQSSWFDSQTKKISNTDHPIVFNHPSGALTQTIRFNWKAVNERYGIMDESAITSIPDYDQELGTKASPYNLYANPTPGTGLGANESANCYVVNQPGWYTFPLVYGNGYKDGSRDESTYIVAGASAQGDAPALGRFINAAGKGMMRPWVQDDLRDNGVSVKEWKPVIIWQDAFPNYYIVDDSAEELFLSSSNKDWITFRIKPYDPETSTGFRPGNVLIGLMGEVDKQWIMAWSWHIWISGDSLAPVSVQQRNGEYNQFLPMNLGWTPPFSYGIKPIFDYIRITQSESGKTAVTKLIRINSAQYYENLIENATLTSEMQGYSNTFYQWGRKDPFLPQSGRVPTGTWDGSKMSGGVGAGSRVVMNSRKDYYRHAHSYHPWQVLQEEGTKYSIRVPKGPMAPDKPTGGNLPQAMTTSDYDSWLTEMIKYPTQIYYDNGGKSLIYYYPEYVNLWNAAQTDYSTSTPVVKTVYDPCPPGFCVPHYDAFSNFTSDGLPVTYTVSTSGYSQVSENYYLGSERQYSNAADRTGGRVFQGMYLPASGKRAYVDGSPQNHSKVGYYWTSSPNRNISGNSGDPRRSVTARRFMFVMDGEQNWLDETNAGYDNRTRVISIRPMVIPAKSGMGADNPGIPIDHWDGTGGFTW